MRRTKEDAAKTREEVLTAAAAVFFEHGVSGSSLDKIAKRAGVTRGAIYWHFKDKAEILTALHSEITLPQEAIVDEARSHEDPLGLIEQKTISVLRMLAEDEHQQRIYAIMIFSCDSADDDSDAAQRIVAANAGMYEKLRSIMLLADELKMLAPSWTVDTAARAFQCSINGLFGEWLRSDKVFPLVDVGERLVAGLIGSMRPAQNLTRTASAA
jgi:TetR/AcrR family acrAB operon transcriptional repressor